MTIPPDHVKVTSPTTGTGSSIVLGAAASNLFFTPAEAGAVDGVTYDYVIEQGGNWEHNAGVYDSNEGTLGRGTPIKSKIGGTAGTTKINLDGTQRVYFPLFQRVVNDHIALTPEMYGAVGDGVTDDTAAINAWLAALGGGKIGVARTGATYKTTGGHAILSGTRLSLYGATFDCGGGSQYVTYFTAAGTVSTSQALNANAAAGATVVTVNTLPAGCQYDSYIRLGSSAIMDPDPPGYDVPFAQIAQATTVSGTGPYTIGFGHKLIKALNTADSAYVQTITPAQNVVIEGGTLVGSFTEGYSQCGILLKWTAHCRVRDVHFKNISGVSVTLSNDFNSVVEHCVMQRAWQLDVSGYGVCIQDACVSSLVTHCHMNYVRHAVSFGNTLDSSYAGVSNGCRVVGNICHYSGSDAFDSHPAHWHITFESNTVMYAVTHGIYVGAPYATIRNNRIMYATDNGIYANNNITDIAGWYTIEGNLIENCEDNGINIISGSSCENQFVSIRNNEVMYAYYMGIKVIGDGPTQAVIENNLLWAQSQAIYVEKCNGYLIEGNACKSNSGSYAVIYILDAPNGSIVGNSLEPTTSGTGIQLNATASADTYYVLINGNRCPVAATYGLAIDNNCTYCSQAANDFQNCSTPYSYGTGTGHRKIDWVNV